MSFVYGNGKAVFDQLAEDFRAVGGEIVAAINTTQVNFRMADINGLSKLLLQKLNLHLPQYMKTYQL
jgi:hypothetical protein